MSTTAPRPDRSSTSEKRMAAALAGLSAWTVVVPWLGRLVGLDVDVATRVEVVDHVVPGLLAAVAGLLLLRMSHRGALRRGRLAAPAAGVGVLAGLWVLATHVPLLIDAAASEQPWAAALWHAATGLPILVLAVGCLLAATSEP